VWAVENGPRNFWNQARVCKQFMQRASDTDGALLLICVSAEEYMRRCSIFKCRCGNTADGLRPVKCASLAHARPRLAKVALEVERQDGGAAGDAWCWKDSWTAKSCRFW